MAVSDDEGGDDAVSLATLLSRSMTLIQRDYLGELDAYGAEIPTDSTTEILGELQQTRRSEPNDAGEFSDTAWTLFLPAGTLINTGDAVICDGERFEVVGAPWPARNPRTGVASHIEASLRRTASAADEETGS